MAEREMEMELLDDVEAAKNDAMEQAKIADTNEEEMYGMISGEFSAPALNKVVDSLNRVNKIFRAPEYPKFEGQQSSPMQLPPEFVRNLDMVARAAVDAGVEDKSFNLSDLKSDKDLKMLAGKLDALAGDKAFKAFLNKPLGMGDQQAEADIPVTQPSGGNPMMAQSSPAAGADGEEELFMARMRG